jgi:hypothetical protein
MVEQDPHVATRRWSVGIDVGQASDPTAVCVVEHLKWSVADWFEERWRMRGKGDRWEQRTGDWMTPEAEAIAKSRGTEFRVRALQRLPLGTDYVSQCELLCAMLARPELASAKVFLDYTGCGRPVSDLLKRGGLKHTPVLITGGTTDQQDGAAWHVAKTNLITRLQAALHAGELKVAAELQEATAFTRELQEFRVSWSEAGHLRFGARQGAHDDLVLAAALAVYGATSLRNEVTFWPLRV